jgi:hypothetical protein
MDIAFKSLNHCMETPVVAKTTISGEIDTENDDPSVRKKLVLLHRDTFNVVAMGISEEDKTFSIKGTPTEDGKLLLLGLDEGGNYNADVYDRLSMCSVSYSGEDTVIGYDEDPGIFRKAWSVPNFNVGTITHAERYAYGLRPLPIWTGFYLTGYRPSLPSTGGNLSYTLPSFTFSGDFTADGWIKPNAVAGDRVIYDCRAGIPDATGFCIYVSSAGKLCFTGGSPAVTTTGTATITSSAWVHFAVVRSSGVIYGYVNGVLDFTRTDATSFNRTFVRIGQDAAYSNLAGLYHADLRMTKNVVRYAAPFSVPTLPAPNRYDDPQWANVVTLLRGQDVPIDSLWQPIDDKDFLWSPGWQTMPIVASPLTPPDPFTPQWISESVDISAFNGMVQTGSKVKWIGACMPPGTDSSTLYTVYVSINSGAWVPCTTNGGAVPGIDNTTDLTGMSVRFRVDMAASASLFPCLKELLFTLY